MKPVPRPHDLLWGFIPEQLPTTAPQWAFAAVASGEPVVVRRAEGKPGVVAVGIRGHGREERFGTWMALDRIVRSLSPEQLVSAIKSYPADLPALKALIWAKPCLDATGLVWGVTGSAGFQLATGIRTLHADSDLDLLMRAPAPLSRSQALALLNKLDKAPCRLDIQLETPQGGIALREWAQSSHRVLLKRASGACLVTDPWHLVEIAA
ncbi:malonate decarboxylase holo-ACP synthase [Pseudomonas asuensis]|uniref:Phosphoribosyl-dephospho-CoA transferase n=1 Tax=Pseudomonas asuensis TaxID=1825787 RepID=A0ABQ2GWV0_9PSED|nr:malonate decarboxylase holo-ACP synthase [Pseudomonas asuensis]GGM15672.1 phosphoribosyl-dephospho-CoA transferase [Pseudomonas asuensis]